LFGAGFKQKWARSAAGLIHDLHRTKFPLTRRMVLPLDVKALEAHLLDIHEVFAAHGVTFWLRDGTALGAWRDGAIIPTDDDIDLGVWVSDTARIDRALEALAGRGFVMYLRTKWVIALMRDWETVELIVSGVFPEDEVYNRFLERAFFRDLGSVDFLGRSFRIPSPIERYLEFSYGEDWRIPKPDAWWSNTWWLPPTTRQAHVAEFIRKYGDAAGKT
jgi:lipopolysaccharide cholinephosphotransferase